MSISLTECGKEERWCCSLVLRNANVSLTYLRVVPIPQQQTFSPSLQENIFNRSSIKDFLKLHDEHAIVSERNIAKPRVNEKPHIKKARKSQAIEQSWMQEQCPKVEKAFSGDFHIYQRFAWMLRLKAWRWRNWKDRYRNHLKSIWWRRLQIRKGNRTLNIRNYGTWNGRKCCVQWDIKTIRVTNQHWGKERKVRRSMQPLEEKLAMTSTEILHNQQTLRANLKDRYCSTQIVSLLLKVCFNFMIKTVFSFANFFYFLRQILVRMSRQYVKLHSLSMHDACVIAL